MKKITDPSKLLPAAKSAAVTRTKRAAIKPSSALVTRPEKESAIVKAPEKSAAIVKKEQKSTEYVNVRLIAIENLFRNDFANVRKEAEEKRKKEEEQDFTEAEKKLETPKTRKLKLGGGGGDSPSLGFFDRVKRFLFFTALGWLLPKIIDFLPKLEGTLKTIGTVYKFAEGLFGKLFDGFMTLVKFGGDLKKQTLGFIAGMKGGDYQTEFTKLEKTFDTFVNASIIAGVLAADIGFAAVDEFNKWRGKNKKLESEKAKPVKRGKEEKPKVTQGRGGRAAAGAASRVTQGKGGKAPGWWNKILRGPFAKLKGPLSKFAGAAVPGLGAVVGAADARARFAAGDRIGGSLASVSAALDVATVASALTGVGLPIAGALSTISIGIDALLLIRDITKTFFPFIPMFSHGGRVVNKYQGGGTARTTRRPPPKPPKVKKPIKTKPPETKVGRDVGGENKVVQFYAKDTKEKTPIFGNFAAALNFFSGGLKNKEQNRPLEALKRTSKILKELPFGLGYFAGGAIDIALGQSMDVKKGLGQLSSGIAYMVDSLANQRVNMSMTSLIRDLNAFAEGGTIPASRTLSTSYSVSSGDLIAKVIGPTIEQKVNEAMQSIEKDLRSLQQKKEEPSHPGPGEPGFYGPGMGGGGALPGDAPPEVNAMLEAIAGAEGGWDSVNPNTTVSGLSNMTIAEARLAAIRKGIGQLGGSGAMGKFQQMPDFILDRARAAGLDPYRDKFNPENQTKIARMLMASVYPGGESSLIKDARENPLKAASHLRGTWPSLPGGTQENIHTRGFLSRFNNAIQVYESGGGTLNIPQGISTGKARRLIVMSGSKGYRQVMPGESAPTDYLHHGREDLRRGLIVRDYGITPQVHGGSQMLEGEGAPLVVPFGMSAKAVVEGKHAIRFEDPKTGAILARYHHVENIPSGINGKVIRGGTFFGTQGGRPGASSAYGSSTAVHTHLEGTAAWHRAFINTYAGGLNVERTNLDRQAQMQGQRSVGERREYDVVIPLDHHTGRLPDKSLWPNASLGAAGRERQAQNPTAELMRRRLEAKGLRVKILRPEDYRTERDYNAALMRFSKAGAVVTALHYDAPRSQGGVGFLARLGASPNKDDRDFANRLAPILRRMAAEAKGNQIYGGIDTTGNITMSKAGPATAALIELGSLVEQEKRYGKQFWNNPEFLKHIDAIANVTASSVQRDQTTTRNVAQGKPNTQGQFTSTRQLGSAIQRLKPGESLNVPGVGKVSRDKNGKPVYIVYGKGQVPAVRFLAAFDAKNKPSKPPPKMQQGGIIKPRGTQLPIPNSYASYESPGSGTLIAIQPYVIEKPAYSSSNRTIAFPVPMALNNTNKNLEALSRG